MIELALPPEVEQLQEAARRVAAEALSSGARVAEAGRAWSPEARAAFAALGTSGLMLPAELGGDGLALAAVVALEALAAGDAGGLLLADRPGPAAFALGVLGDGELARAVREGEASVGLLVAESLECPEGWVPGEGCPDALVVVTPKEVAGVDPGAFEVSPAPLGAFEASGGVWLRAPDRPTVLEERSGEDGAFEARAGARLWAGAVLTGVAQAALDYAVAYGRERVVFGSPVLGHQANAFEAAAAHARIEAARTAVRVAAHRFDQGRARTRVDGAWLATLAYLEACDAARGATDLALMLLGGHGYIRDHPVEKWWREARALIRLFGGPDAALEDLMDRVLTAPDPLVA